MTHNDAEAELRLQRELRSIYQSRFLRLVRDDNVHGFLRLDGGQNRGKIEIAYNAARRAGQRIDELNETLRRRAD